MNIFSRLGFSRKANEPFSFESKDGVLELMIYEEISYWGVRATDVARAIKYAGEVEQILVRINSPGGVSTEGVAIYNTLVNSGAHVKVRVEGIAASAASLIAMAGDEIEMGDGSMMMIHEAWVYAAGPIEELEKAIEMLGVVNKSYGGIYEKRSGKTEQDVAEIMRAETWYTAKDAVTAGFADTVGKAVEEEAEARFDLTSFGYQNIPDRLLEMSARAQTRSSARLSTLLPASLTHVAEGEDEEAPDGDTTRTGEEATAQQKEDTMSDQTQASANAEVETPDTAAVMRGVLTACREANLPEASAKLAETCTSVEEATERLEELKTIQSACAAAKTPTLFQSAIDNGLGLKAVTEMIAQARGDVAATEEEVTTTQGEGQAAPAGYWDGIDPAKQYAKLNNND